MHILVLTDRFVPEVGAPSQRALDHARVWLRQGHEVTVVTGAPNAPRGEVFNGYCNRLYQEEWIEGVRVIRLWTYIAPQSGKFRRALDYMSFMVSAVIQCWRFPRFDVMLVSAPPIFTAMAGLAISMLRRRPWVFLVRDLWPASIRALGLSRSPMLKCFEWIELFLYRSANRVVTATHGLKKDLMRRRIPEEKIDVITNGFDPERFDVQSVKFDARARLGMARGAFVCGHIGTVGLAHGLDVLLHAAEILRHRSDLQFVVVGDGTDKPRLMDLAARLNLDNVMFHDSVPHEDVPSFLGALDLAFVSTRQGALFLSTFCSKIPELMAMSVPCLIVAEGESADVVREADAGVCIAFGEPASLPERIAGEILSLAADPGRLKRLGENGRRAALTGFDRRVLAERELDALVSVTKVSPQPSEFSATATNP